MKVKYLGESDPLSFINGKVYEVLSIEYGYYRIVDETDEDFLYDVDFFEVVEESYEVEIIDDEDDKTSDAEIALMLLSNESLKFVQQETGFSKEVIAKMTDDEFADLYDIIADIEINADLEEYSTPSERLDKASNFITIVGNALYMPEENRIRVVMSRSKGKRVRCIEKNGKEWIGVVDAYESAYDNEDDEIPEDSICISCDNGSNVLVYAEDIKHIAIIRETTNEKKSLKPSQINHLDFKLIDPVLANERWTDGEKNLPDVVEIYIDGVEIVEIFRKIEVPYCEQEGHPNLAGDYGHIPAKELYRDLSEATIEGSYSYDLGVYPVCCGGCGEPGCWSVTFRVRESDEFIWWYKFEHERREWKYDLEFKFLKSDYLKEMNKLIEWKK